MSPWAGDTVHSSPDAPITDYLRESGGGSGRTSATAVQRNRRTVTHALEVLACQGLVDETDGPHGATAVVSPMSGAVVQTQSNPLDRATRWRLSPDAVRQ
jgi:predicted transcriptional regulator